MWIVVLGCSLIFDPFPNIRSKNDIGTSIPLIECVHCEAALPVAFFLVKNLRRWNHRISPAACGDLHDIYILFGSSNICYIGGHSRINLLWCLCWNGMSLEFRRYPLLSAPSSPAKPRTVDSLNCRRTGPHHVCGSSNIGKYQLFVSENPASFSFRFFRPEYLCMIDASSRQLIRFQNFPDRVTFRDGGSTDFEKFFTFNYNAAGKILPLFPMLLMLSSDQKFLERLISFDMVITKFSFWHIFRF